MKITKETRETVGSLLGAVAGFVLFYWLGGFITPRVNFILWCYLAVWLFWGKSSSTDKEEKYVMRERLCSVEKALQKLDQQYAYKMEVSVWPDWDEIFTKLYGSKKWHDEFDEETKKEYHDPAKAGRGIAD